MRLRDDYDWVVIGYSPAALLSASLVARLGLSALVLPIGPSSGVRVSDDGQHLDPESNYLLGIHPVGEQKGLVGDCLSRLDLLSSELDVLIARPSQLVVTPWQRLEVGIGPDELFSSLKREIGSEAAERLGLANALKRSEREILGFWQELPLRLTLLANRPNNHANSKKRRSSPRNLEDLLRRLGSQAELNKNPHKVWFKPDFRLDSKARCFSDVDGLEELCMGLWSLGSAGLGANPGLQDILGIIGLMRTGSSVKGGIGAYREVLLRVARRFGAHAPAKAECGMIFIDKGRFAGVQVASHGNMITAKGGILGCSLDRAKERVTVSGRSLFKKFKTAPTPDGWKFTLAVSVHSEAVPPGAPRRMVWQEKGGPPLEVEIASCAEYGSVDAEHSLIFLRTILPFKMESLRVEYQRLVAARMVRQLTEIFPFVEFHVRRIFPDFRADIRGDFRVESGSSQAKSQELVHGELASIYGFASLDEIPDGWRCYSGEGVGPRSGVDGLFVASDEAFPRLGSFGGVAAAVEAVAWLAHRFGLPGPLT